MNKKNNILIVLMLFFASEMSFAAQAGNLTYDQVLAAYTYGRLNEINTEEAVSIVQSHKKGLEDRKKAVESSYVPALFEKVANGLLLTAVGLFGAAAGGAIESYNILNQSPNIMFTTLASGPGLNYFEWMRVKYGRKQDMITSAKTAHTESFLETLPDSEKAALNLGLMMPPLVIGSLVVSAISHYLSKKAASYKSEVKELEESIMKDNNMLRALGMRI